MATYLIISLILMIINSSVVFYCRDEVLEFWNGQMDFQVTMDIMGTAILIGCLIPILRWFFTIGIFVSSQ